MVYAGNIAIDRRLRLRWRFDFRTRPSKFGIWNNSGGQQNETFGTAAWCVDKTGLSRAAVEGEIIDENGSYTGQVVPLVECDGWDFVNFAWTAATPAPIFGGPGTVTLAGQVVGLSLESRDFVHKVYVDGRIQKIVKTDADKKINLAGFGK